MIFQQTALFNTNVFDNVALPLKFRKEMKTILEEGLGKCLNLYS